MNETWAHHLDPETNLQSKQWKHATSLISVKFYKIDSAKKVVTSIFWDREGVLMTDHLEQGKNFTGVYHTELIKKLYAVFKGKRRRNLASRCAALSRQRIAQTYMYTVAITSIVWLRALYAASPAVFSRAGSI